MANRIGKEAEKAIEAIRMLESSPRMRMNTGTSATGGMLRMKSTTGSMYRAAVRFDPTRTPSGTAIAIAMRKPIARFCSVGTTWIPQNCQIQLNWNCSQMSESGGKYGSTESALAVHHQATMATGSQPPMRMARIQCAMRLIARSRRRCGAGLG